MLAGGRLRGMLRHPDPPLGDDVITLRAKTRDDADALVRICQDPAIPRWTRVPVPYRRRDAEAWIAVSELDLAAGTGIDWLAVDEHDEVLASVAVQDIRQDEGTGEIGYWVAAHARGRGVATRAVRLATEWALGELGLKTIEIMTHEDNAPSQAVARAAGYTETGETMVPPREGLPPGRYLVFTPA
jgi:RimJ/RimL family protein N-acetyltransferase